MPLHKKKEQIHSYATPNSKPQNTSDIFKAQVLQALYITWLVLSQPCPLD